jgi:hypothetical protein
MNVKGSCGHEFGDAILDSTLGEGAFPLARDQVWESYT